MGATLPQLGSCCCGCSLRTGTLIILWLYLIVGISYMVSPAIRAGYANPSATNTTGTTTGGNQSPMTNKDAYDFLNSYPPTVVFASGLISTIVAAAGLYGVYKEISVYLVAFLVWEMVLVLVVDVGLLIASFSVVNILAIIIVFAVFLYFWLVVFSHYRVLKGSARPTQP